MNWGATSGSKSCGRHITRKKVDPKRLVSKYRKGKWYKGIVEDYDVKPIAGVWELFDDHEQSTEISTQASASSTDASQVYSTLQQEYRHRVKRDGDGHLIVAGGGLGAKKRGEDGVHSDLLCSFFKRIKFNPKDLKETKSPSPRDPNAIADDDGADGDNANTPTQIVPANPGYVKKNPGKRKAELSPGGSSSTGPGRPTGISAAVKLRTLSQGQEAVAAINGYFALVGDEEGFRSLTPKVVKSHRDRINRLLLGKTAAAFEPDPNNPVSEPSDVRVQLELQREMLDRLEPIAISMGASADDPAYDAKHLLGCVRSFEKAVARPKIELSNVVLKTIVERSIRSFVMLSIEEPTLEMTRAVVAHFRSDNEVDDDAFNVKMLLRRGDSGDSISAECLYDLFISAITAYMAKFEELFAVEAGNISENGDDSSHEVIATVSKPLLNFAELFESECIKEDSGEHLKTAVSCVKAVTNFQLEDITAVRSSIDTLKRFC